MPLSIAPISAERSDCGEGPIWNPKTNTVSWVDIAGKKWHQVELRGGALTKTFVVPTIIGAIVERSKGGYFAAVKEGYGSINANGEYSPEMKFLPRDERMNDAKVDSGGRFWAGSTALDFTLGKGKLHVLESGREDRIVETGLALPNGLGWSPDNKFLYFVDSMQRVMWRYDFDEVAGSISNRKVLVVFPEDGSLPDGLCVADDGSIFVAMWDGSRIEVFNADGAARQTIAMPVKRPTSCTFVGANRDILAVTSAAGEQDLTKYPFSGFTLAVTGLPYTGPASEIFHG